MEKELSSYDIVILGNYTKDTIVKKDEIKYVDGGGFNYGAHAAAKSGLKVAAVTRLAKEDYRIVEKLQNIGVDVYPTFTSSSTHMRLEYPTDNVDDRILKCSVTAGTYTPEQFDGLKAKAFLINASVREEVPIEIIKKIRKKSSFLVADVQGFIRIIAPDRTLIHAEWPEMHETLSFIDVLKADIVEAESLTGEKDIRIAAKRINEWGPSEVVITHRDGILVLTENKFYEAEFRPKELVGRSGRGDTCIASYMAKRLSSEPSEAIIWSAALTSLKLETEGPFGGDLNDIQEMINRNYN